MRAKAALLLALALAGDPPAPVATRTPSPERPACGCSDLCVCGCRTGAACRCRTLDSGPPVCTPGPGSPPQRVEVWPATAQPTPAPVSIYPAPVQAPAPTLFPRLAPAVMPVGPVRGLVPC